MRKLLTIALTASVLVGTLVVPAAAANAASDPSGCVPLKRAAQLFESSSGEGIPLITRGIPCYNADSAYGHHLITDLTAAGNAINSYDQATAKAIVVRDVLAYFAAMRRPRSESQQWLADARAANPSALIQRDYLLRIYTVLVYAYADNRYRKQNTDAIYQVFKTADKYLRPKKLKEALRLPTEAARRNFLVVVVKDMNQLILASATVAHEINDRQVAEHFAYQISIADH